jgi:hypothetical protein
MADTIYTRALNQAAAAQGSTQALATLLNVPENTLLRWMSGRAQMPLRGFLRVVELVSQHEKSGGAVDSGVQIPQNGKLRFAMGDLHARCARCDSTEFEPSEPGPRLRMSSELVCVSCGERVTHGNLISQLAADTVQQSRAMTVARNRRQAGILKRPLKSS